MGIRDNRYEADGAAGRGVARRRRSVHEPEARLARATHERTLKFTLPGPMTICRHHRRPLLRRPREDGVRLRRAAQPGSARARTDGVDVIQFDEPAFNVYMTRPSNGACRRSSSAAEGCRCTTAVHICYGYGIEANIDWKERSARMAPVREDLPGAGEPDRAGLARCRGHVPPEPMKLLRARTCWWA